jgi:uncharacterized protein (DUF2062 family)
LKKAISSLYQKFRQLQGSPASLARGTAIGVFIGIAPLMPFKSVLIVLITVAARSSTVAALLVCTVICNPFTYIPLYYFSWLVGNFVMPGRTSWESLIAAINRMQEAGLVAAIPLVGQIGFDAGAVLLAGGLVLALPMAFCSYPVALRFFVKIERKRYEKHLLNKNVEEPAP